MLNRRYFYGIHAEILKIIKNSNMDDKEKIYRKDKANKKIRKLLKNEEIDNHYYALVHELKSYELLKNYGKVKMASDLRNEEGPDIKVNNYYIECVCCSPGETIDELNKYRVNEYKKSAVFDYNKKLEILLPRITSSLNEKAKKYRKYINDGIVHEKDCCIIYISLGELYTDFFSGDYGFDLLNVLIGKSHLSLRIDKNTGKFVDSFYNHVETIKKHNGSDIDANFFVNQSNDHISGILFADVNMCDNYSIENTFLFLNPYAKNKIKTKDFKDMIYWKANKKGEYIPRKNGKNLWHNLNKKFF